MSLEHKFSVIGMCETWLKTTNCNLYGYDGYEAEYRCREHRKGCGISLYISNHIEYKRRHDLESLFHVWKVEIVCDEIPGKLFNTKPIIVAVMYRPPNTYVNDWLLVWISSYHVSARRVNCRILWVITMSTV